MAAALAALAFKSQPLALNRLSAVRYELVAKHF